MARPIKTGLDYFPLDTGLDEKFELLEAKHGVQGFGIIIKLYQKAYREYGYFYPWTEREQLLFSRWVNVDINLINVIINDAVKYGIFDEGMAGKGILTSTGIQKRFIEATKRRIELSVYTNILLVNVSSIPVNVNNKPRAVELLIYGSTQSKVKESKGNNKESIRVPSQPEKKTKVFTPPTLLEIGEYCRSKGYGFEPMRFWNYYESKGWLVGKARMKNWRRAADNWNLNEINNRRPLKVFERTTSLDLAEV